MSASELAIQGWAEDSFDLKGLTSPSPAGRAAVSIHVCAVHSCIGAHCISMRADAGQQIGLISPPASGGLPSQSTVQYLRHEPR
jgi:hypothetical protein